MTTINIALEVSDKHCADIICTALEGGIGYWCAADDIVKTGTREQREAGADWDYVSFVAYDDEEYDEDNPDASKLGAVTYDTIRKGIEAILAGRVKVNNDITAGILHDITRDEMGVYIDADVADVIVQAGLLNEIRFG